MLRRVVSSVAMRACGTLSSLCREINVFRKPSKHIQQSQRVLLDEPIIVQMKRPQSHPFWPAGHGLNLTCHPMAVAVKQAVCLSMHMGKRSAIEAAGSCL